MNSNNSFLNINSPLKNLQNKNQNIIKNIFLNFEYYIIFNIKNSKIIHKLFIINIFYISKDIFISKIVKLIKNIFIL